ncbi:MAG: type II toxin-antitoxin system RelE/ParE family toxin [Candidatus Bipolaricaulota bacterium]|nr:type II toxin-antitoxin system RelE/ParE family toxin [Candidatus Bipolaricaulota bacterium]
MSYTIEFVAGAVADLKALDPPLQKLAWKQIEKIAEAPELGKLLGKRMGYDLTGLRTIRFYRQAYRVVYEVFERTKTVRIWGIGRREREEIYRAVAQRRVETS